MTRARPQAPPAPPAPPASRAPAAASEADEVYARIYAAIQEHRLAPGTKLKEIPLAERFGVTRGTVRKALARLAAVGVVEQRPNRGAIVASPSIEETRELFAARRAIEGAIVESLAPAITRAGLKRLAALIRKEDLAYRRGDTREALKHSVDFHRVLAELAGNRTLAAMLEQLVSRTPLVVLAWRDPAKPSACANADHAELVAALAAGDPRRARATMTGHLCNLENQLRLVDAGTRDALASIFEGGAA